MHCNIRLYAVETNLILFEKEVKGMRISPKSLMLSNNKATEQLKVVNAVESNFRMLSTDVIWLRYKI